MHRFFSLIALTVGLVLVAPVAASPIEVDQHTANYTIVLGIGPVETMLMPDQAAGATSGEVMVPMPGMPMMPTMPTPMMMMTDQGQPVNHHLEIHLANKATGAVITDQMPMLTITDARGMSRPLVPLMAMYGVTAGVSDWHYGKAVYLPDGVYTLRVQVGNEQTVFNSLMVTDEAAMAPMPAMSPMPMPMAQGPAVYVVRRLGDG